MDSTSDGNFDLSTLDCSFLDDWEQESHDFDILDALNLHDGNLEDVHLIDPGAENSGQANVDQHAIDIDAMNMDLPAAKRRVACPTCGLLLLRKTLKRHMNTKHAATQLQFQCSHCPSQFAREDILRRHEVTQHLSTMETVPCPHCGIHIRQRALLEHQASQKCNRARQFVAKKLDLISAAQSFGPQAMTDALAACCYLFMKAWVFEETSNKVGPMSSRVALCSTLPSLDLMILGRLRHEAMHSTRCVLALRIRTPDEYDYAMVLVWLLKEADENIFGFGSVQSNSHLKYLISQYFHFNNTPGPANAMSRLILAARNEYIKSLPRAEQDRLVLGLEDLGDWIEKLRLYHVALPPALTAGSVHDNSKDVGRLYHMLTNDWTTEDWRCLDRGFTQSPFDNVYYDGVYFAFQSCCLLASGSRPCRMHWNRPVPRVNLSEEDFGEELPEEIIVISKGNTPRVAGQQYQQTFDANCQEVNGIIESHNAKPTTLPAKCHEPGIIIEKHRTHSTNFCLSRDFAEFGYYFARRKVSLPPIVK